MTTEEFASAAFQDVVVQGTIEYEQALQTTDAASITDSYWRDLSDLYCRLSGEDQSVIVRIMRQSQIDAIATLFASIDGVTRLQGQSEGTVLLTDRGDQISGGLSDAFLLLAEESE